MYVYVYIIKYYIYRTSKNSKVMHHLYCYFHSLITAVEVNQTKIQ